MMFDSKAFARSCEFVIEVLFGAFCGWMIDSWWDISPVGLIVMTLVGFGAAVYNIAREQDK